MTHARTGLGEENVHAPKQTMPTRQNIKHMKFVFVEIVVNYSFQMTDA